MEPRIYVGQTPDTTDGRILLRERTLMLAHFVHRSPTEGVCAIAFNVTLGTESPLTRIDLIMMRTTAVIVGALRTCTGPIDALPGGVWRDRAGGRPILDADGLHPLHRIRVQRDAVQRSLNATAMRFGLASTDPRPFKRVIGAIVGVPAIHADSRISLDVDDHRDHLKVCSFEELPGVAALAHSGVVLSVESIHTIITDLFGCRLWYDNEHFLFELAPPQFQLYITAPGRAPMRVPLYEGETIVGRRQSAQGTERRITLSDDELVSSDHLHILCTDDPAGVTMRDTSKNGVWITLPDGYIEHIRHAERTVPVGARLRLGMTDIMLERI
ncbi:MAG: FHA domain-containing protein [Roseiflexus sp.]